MNLHVSAGSLTILLMAIYSCCYGGTLQDDHDLNNYVTGLLKDYKDTAFVLYNSAEDSYYRYNEEACNRRVPPASTFKIYNSLIAIETGVVSGPDSTFKWDGRQRGLEIWNRDHTLASAVRNSVVWYFQKVATLIGEKRMKSFLAQLDYGNQNISDGLTTFWLTGSLKISADEQVDLLRKLVGYRLPFSHNNVDQVISLIRQDYLGHPDIYGKTGTTGLLDGLLTSWFVGFLKTEGNTYIFALNIQGSGKISGFPARDIVFKILAKLTSTKK